MKKTANMGQPVVNRHKVPKHQWNKWTNHAKKVFNDMMKSMRPRMQWAFLHSSATPMTTEQWRITQWNAAWTAANVADGRGSLKRVVNVTPKKAARRGK